MRHFGAVLAAAAGLFLLPVSGPMPAAPSVGFAASAFAVQPDEILADAGLERRARALSAGLRCLVCQNQSIDDSDADLARDLRVLVRERLVAGDSDAAVVDHIVARYGEFVLLRPRLSAGTVALWGAPVLLLLAGGLFAARQARRRPAVQGHASLTAAEEAAVETLLQDKGL